MFCAVRPLWSSAILDELEYHETQKLINRGADDSAAAEPATHLIAQMNAAFDDALVENWQPHEGAFGLPDPDDEYVVAAALVAAPAKRPSARVCRTYRSPTIRTPAAVCPRVRELRPNRRHR